MEIDHYLQLIELYVAQTATIHIYSFPNFILETFITIIICIIYAFLHLEVNKVRKKLLRWKPYVVIPAEIPAIKRQHSSESVSASVTTHYCEVYKSTGEPKTTIAYRKLTKNFSTHSQNGWILPVKPTTNNCNVDAKDIYDKLPYITPEQFVRMDKERKIREKKFDNYMLSLSTLCQNVIKKKYSQNTLSKQVEMTKEHLQCSRIAEGNYMQCRTGAMSDSLFNMLEGMITKTSLVNPMPFKGDITTFALDISDITKRSENTYTFNNGIENWDTNSTARFSDVSCATTADTANAFKEDSHSYSSSTEGKVEH